MQKQKRSADATHLWTTADVEMVEVIPTYIITIIVAAMIMTAMTLMEVAVAVVAVVAMMSPRAKIGDALALRTTAKFLPY